MIRLDMILSEHRYTQTTYVPTSEETGDPSMPSTPEQAVDNINNLIHHGTLMQLMDDNGVPTDEYINSAHIVKITIVRQTADVDAPVLER